jgi:hypothetical protein
VCWELIDIFCRLPYDEDDDRNRKMYMELISKKFTEFENLEVVDVFKKVRDDFFHSARLIAVKFVFVCRL